jgi:hypothetical protein
VIFLKVRAGHSVRAYILCKHRTACQHCQYEPQSYYR